MNKTAKNKYQPSYNDYHICLTYSPASNIPQYPLIFWEIITLLFHSFTALGRACTFKVNQLEKEKTNIVIGNTITNPNLPELLAGIKYILYQLEPLSGAGGSYFKSAILRNIIQNASDVWDYSGNNVEFLKAENVNSKLLIPGYDKNLENIINAKNKDIDVLFYGGLDGRRLQILQELESRGVKVKILSDTYGQERDQYIARSKIVINIHCFGMEIFESARIHYLLNNKVFVLTEQSSDNPYTKVDMVCVSYEHLVDECVRRLADWENSQKLAELNHEQFKKYYPMTELLEKVI